MLSELLKSFGSLLRTTAPAMKRQYADNDGKQAKRQCKRLRRFVFTLNNWTQEEYQLVIGLPGTKPIRWLVVAKEVGENGTPHLQGACCLSSQIAFSQIKTWPGLTRAHLETMLGTPQDSLVYCSKQDSAPFVFGNLPQQGKRTDVLNAVEEIKEGKTLRQLAESQPVAVVKFFKGLTVLRSLTRPHRSGRPYVYWLYGSTGTGKTRTAFAVAQKIGGQDGVWISSGTLKWFDGYDGQPCVIFDDFRTKGVSFSFLLRLLDRYPMQVEFKGGHVNWEPKWIFITCPDSIDTVFAARQEHLPEDINQLKRRVTRSFKFPDGVKDFTNQIEFLLASPEEAADMHRDSEGVIEVHEQDDEEVTTTDEFLFDS